MIVTNVNKMTKTYSVNDILPSQNDADGLISVNLYAGAQDTWTERCKRNHVPVDIPVFDANKTTMNFIIITPQNDVDVPLTKVKGYNFENEVVSEIAADSLDL